ncbi:MAG: 2-phospho-L-lactate guanylyltransferase [Rhodospirillales bacterium]|nr:2-phospho-L-lactate guanylyltransferase [Rhodospirillales bacterium]
MRDIWAALPVKALAGAKQRLSAALSPAQRQGLMRAMLGDVLAALAAAPLAGIVVNTADAEVAALARDHGARVVCLDADRGHTAAVTALARLLAAEGHAGLLTVPGDIPAITAAEIATLIAAHGAAPAISIVPAHDRRGSNAILCTPPDALAFAFGDDSFLPHLATARAGGIEPRIVTLAGIGMDVDHPADLAMLLDAPQAQGTRAVAFLRAAGIRPPSSRNLRAG